MNFNWVKKITLIDGIIVLGLGLMIVGLGMKMKETKVLGESNKLIMVETREKAVVGRVNINTAGLVELETLPGIGPKMAQRIIDYRNNVGIFKSITGIKNVSGIGEKTYEKLADKIGI
jgi:competence protein ComEA